ncbi:syntaxin-112-like [Salvia miltiorrhiza]|uniref:syntaxin-112-like n=1 Tax=Salvia miltiorrhiza TaxID=226208 RepID=UPI0025AD4866|nr:syntaxin-112-like [Salvia miltiorrhiza]XP_057783118.1 syntaxin-112-like [Salvia miltiorrhiza]
MNDLMTKSFLSYVDLKKQAMKDVERDVEMGQLEPSHEMNLSKFLEEAGAVKAEMEEITNLLLHLQHLHDETKSAQSSKILRGLTDQINSDMVTVLRKAKTIKSRLESLDKSNVANRSLSADYREGGHVDRTRTGVTHGLRIKLKEMMNDFQCLREKIVQEHKQGVESSDGMVERATSDGRVVVFDGKGELFEENRQRDEAVKDLQRSLVELHQVFLDMAVMVDAQADNLNNIEQNVVSAASDVRGGAKELDRASQMKKRRTCACWIGVVLLVLMLVCLIAIFF